MSSKGRLKKTKEMDNICVGIDIGTTKVTAIVAKELEEGRLEIIAVGKALPMVLFEGKFKMCDKRKKPLKRR